MAQMRRPSSTSDSATLDDDEPNPFLPSSPPPPTAPGAAPPLPPRDISAGSLPHTAHRGREIGRTERPVSAPESVSSGGGASVASGNPFAPADDASRGKTAGHRPSGTQGQPPMNLTPDEQEAVDIAAAIAASRASSRATSPASDMAAAIAASRESFTRDNGSSGAFDSNGLHTRRTSGSAGAGSVAGGSSNAAQQREADSGKGKTSPGASVGGSSRHKSGGSFSRGSQTPPRSRSNTGGSAGPVVDGVPTTSGGGSGGGSGGAAAAAGSRNPFDPPASAIPTVRGTAVVDASSAAAANAEQSSSRGGQVEGNSGGQTNSWNWTGIGRSLFGAMMRAAAGEENPAGAASDAATARAIAGKKGFAPSVRELTPHVMQQTAGGKFSVVVTRKNKQDIKPVQVSVGIYETAYEGKRAAEAFSPPIWQEPNRKSTCAVCSSTFGFLLKRRHHCRNCGRLVCSACAEAFWPRSMLPPTYNVDTTEKKVRVCTTCYDAGERFRKALLSGCEEEAMAAFSTGCVNLRVPYTIYHNELPVHCAAAGGNLNILAWLIEDRCCPLFLDRDKKVALGDSRKLSVMGAAAASGHITIMRYLAYTQGCKVTEIRDMHTLWRALEKCLLEGSNVVSEENDPHRSRRHTGDPPAMTMVGGGSGGGARVGGGGGGSGGGAYAVGGHQANGNGGAEVAAAAGDDDTGCIVCFERPVDCTLVPCGHHCCCLECAAQFELCPVCRAPVEQKIRAISV